MRTFRWVLQEIEQPDRVPAVQAALNNLPESLARCLVLRGISTLDAARLFFRPSLEEVHDPFLMLDMDVAAERVARAVQTGERVLVYGDYDVDGTTATALMVTFLRDQGVEASYFIPNRFEDGYGLSNTGIDVATERGASLVIALDCGITATDEAAYAKERGIDLIICDHHTAHAEIPDAVAVLDPKRPGCAYPYKELSGCGVGFKLAQATLTTLGKDPEAALPLLDLLAVSTAADIVPITGENRLLMHEGLRRLACTNRLGLQALAETAGLDLGEASTERIVFGIGPRINAAGRLGSADRAVDLLLADDPAEARRLAGELERINRKRKDLDRTIAEEAVRQAEKQMTIRQRHALVLHEPSWHQGVIGIVASRVLETFHRPTVMLCTANGAAKGSARSIDGINIFDAIQSCSDLLTKFGGHAHAAGMTLPEENIPAFRDRLNERVAEVVTPELMLPKHLYDADLPLHEIGHERSRFWAILKQFAPHGPHNLAPVFRGSDLEVSGTPKLVGGDKTHLRFDVQQRGRNGATRFPVIGFGMHKHLATLEQSRREGNPFEMLFSISENTWRGRTTLQLQARDLRMPK